MVDLKAAAAAEVRAPVHGDLGFRLEVKAEADRFAANVLPIIGEAQRAGARTLREIAEALNARGIATARGGQWYAQSVANILERA